MAIDAPAHVNLLAYKGVALRRRISVVNKSDGLARNLTGYNARMQIREDVDDAAALLTLTSGSGITVDNANGYVDILLTKTQTAAFTVATAVWDLWIDNGGSDSPELLAGGGLTIRKAVTQ